MSYKPATATVDIDVDADLSTPIDCRGWLLTKIFIPSNFDGTEIKFHMATTIDGTYSVIEDAGVEVTQTVSASAWQKLDPALMAGIPFLKIETVTDQATTDTVFAFVGVDD
jgi:hypothetical protein